jgi:hypothetical protein
MHECIMNHTPYGEKIPRRPAQSAVGADFG